MISYFFTFSSIAGSNSGGLVITISFIPSRLAFSKARSTSALVFMATGADRVGHEPGCFHLGHDSGQLLGRGRHQGEVHFLEAEVLDARPLAHRQGFVQIEIAEGVSGDRQPLGQGFAGVARRRALRIGRRGQNVTAAEAQGHKRGTRLQETAPAADEIRPLECNVFAHKKYPLAKNWKTFRGKRGGFIQIGYFTASGVGVQVSRGRRGE